MVWSKWDLGWPDGPRGRGRALGSDVRHECDARLADRLGWLNCNMSAS